MSEQVGSRGVAGTTGSDAPGGARQAYEAPQAQFVPLQVEERLMACNKVCATLSTCSLAPINPSS